MKEIIYWLLILDSTTNSDLYGIRRSFQGHLDDSVGCHVPVRYMHTNQDQTAVESLKLI